MMDSPKVYATAATNAVERANANGRTEQFWLAVAQVQATLAIAAAIERSGNDD